MNEPQVQDIERFVGPPARTPSPLGSMVRYDDYEQIVTSLQERVVELEKRNEKLLEVAGREAGKARRSGESGSEIVRAAMGSAGREADRAEKAEARLKEVEQLADRLRNEVEGDRVLVLADELEALATTQKETEGETPNGD